jgi:hypothetical protein
MRNITFCLLALLAVCSVLPAAAQEGYQHPTWRIAKLAKPPVIDGVIRPEEYAGVPAITGMVTYGEHQSIVAEMQEVIWYVGYDDTHLYISMHSPHPKGTWPKARIKEMDNGEILWDDHTEIQIATQGRQKIAAPGKGFYKIMNNANGFVSDEWFYNGTPGTEKSWSIGGDYKCTVTETYWDMEMSVSLDAFREKKLDGKSWVLQLLRADNPGGVYFAGWVGATWMSWGSFGEVVFDPAAPVFRFLRTGEVAKGTLNLGFEARGRGDAETPVTVTVTATDPKGTVLYTEQRRQPVGAKTVAFDMKKQIAWPDTGTSHLRITATMPGADGAPAVLYDTDIPVKSLAPPTAWASRVDPWLKQKPVSGQPAWRFAYWPSYGVAEARIDTDFFGMDAAKLAAKRFEVSIARKGGGDQVARQTAPVANKAGHLLFTPGDLPPGEYVATITLLGEHGKAVFTGTREFRRTKYPWEGNTLGTEDIVLPPYKPIEVVDNDPQAPVLKPVLREITAGITGLPAKIRAAGGAGMEDILTAPIAFDVQHDRPARGLLPAGLTVKKKSPTQVHLEAVNPLGSIPSTLKATMAYDGWWDVQLIIPADPTVTVRRLTLVLPLWKAADTIYVQRGNDGFAFGNKMGAIPAGTGVVWDSSKLGSDKHLRDTWGTFAPIAYAGTGDKGLWWFAEECRDWTLNPDLPAIQYIRTDKGVELRINIIAAPTTLDRERTIHFALLADPVKKQADERKWQWAWGGKEYAHSTFGWREWGHSHDGYYMTDDDRAALRDVLTGTKPFAVATGGFAEKAVKMAKTGGNIVLYGSTGNMMLDLPEWDTFSGEWHGSSYIPSDEKLPSPGHPNMQGSYTCPLVRDTQEQGCNWAPSQVACFLWYHDKLLRECPVNGTWWDNGSNFEIRDYDPARKAFYLKWNVFVRRDLCKRLNTIGTLANRPPWWINNCHVDWSFNQVSWHIENDFYVDGPGNTLLDQMTVDNFRAYARLKRGIIHRLATRYGGNDTCTIEERRRRARNAIGLCLLHDIGAYQWDDMYTEFTRLPNLLHEYVGYFNEENGDDPCAFTGYWRSAPLVQCTTPDVYVSVYRGKGRAVLVILNGRKEARDVTLKINEQALLGRKLRDVFDAEDKHSLNVWGSYERPDHLGIEPHGLRMLVVE